MVSSFTRRDGTAPTILCTMVPYRVVFYAKYMVHRFTPGLRIFPALSLRGELGEEITCIQIPQVNALLVLKA